MSRNPYHHDGAAVRDRELVDGKSWSGANRSAVLTISKESNWLQVDVG